MEVLLVMNVHVELNQTSLERSVYLAKMEHTQLVEVNVKSVQLELFLQMMLHVNVLLVVKDQK